MLAALQSFLASSAIVEPLAMAEWSLALAEAVLDHGEDLILRRPLLDALVLPALVRAYRAGAPRPAWWLAQLSTELVGNRALHDELGRPGEIDLLRVAFERNPNEEECRHRLCECLTQQIKYALHELPAGILFGANRATADELEVLSRELDLLESLEPGSALVTRAKLHFAAYADWLRIGEGSYAAYFEALSRKRT